MTYQPKPIDTTDVDLTSDILELTEKLAENAHEHWAQGRLSEGWSHGETRDDKRKQHPDLVPYSALSDSEKEYDRKSAMETLKAIVALGYEITRRS